MLRRRCTRLAPVRIALAVIAVLLGAVGPGVVRAANFVRAPGGPFLTDSEGRRLILHGVNLVPKCGADTQPANAPGTPCVPGGFGHPNYVLTPDAADPGWRFTAADAKTLHDLGFRLVRLGIDWAGLEPGPAGAQSNDPRYCTTHVTGTPFPDLGANDPYSQAALDAYLSQVDVVVRLLSAQGIRVLIDMHQDGWGRPFANPASATPWMAEGAPAWATCTNPAPFSDPATWQGAYTDPAVNVALDHFWSNDVSADLQGQFIRVWTAVARHYAANEDVIGYDLFNEPSDPTELVQPDFDRRLACFYSGTAYAPGDCALANSQTPAEGLIPSVLAADPNHLAFFEMPVLTDYGLPSTLGALADLPFSRLALSFHVYGGTPGQGGFDCEQPSCAVQEQSTFNTFSTTRSAVQSQQPGGPAWLLSEFGAEDYVPDVARMAALADTHLVSWTYWAGLQLHDPTGGPTEGLINDETRRPDPARAAVLARPYALATAGTPTSESFDPASQDFTLHYTPDPAVRAPTEIVVPTAWHYRDGYRVQVTGGRMTSKPGADLLTVANQAGVAEVVVRITPIAATGRGRSRRRSSHRRRHRHRAVSRAPIRFTG